MYPDMAARLAKLQAKLGVEFKNPDLLLQALTHRSRLNEDKLSLGHNERMEFLGDAVIEIITTDFLYRKFPETDEGELTAYRSALVNSKALEEVAKKLELDNCVLRSNGLDTDRTAKHRLLACAFEAIIGALYLDQGLGACRLVIDYHIHRRTSAMIEAYHDKKSAFQELAQERFGHTPIYKVIKTSGSDHAMTFVVAVCLDEIEVGKGMGTSKKEASKKAADAALASITTWEGRFRERSRSQERPSRNQTTRGAT